MAKPKKQVDHEAEDAQPALVPMSDGEVNEAGRALAGKVRELEEMELKHNDARKRFREAEANKRGEIAGIASTIRNQGR